MDGGERRQPSFAASGSGYGLKVPIAAHPYADFLATLEKPARYSGGEVGSVRKDWSSVQARICLAFPDVYEVGMSHLGYRILYDILNRDSRTLAERCYCPWQDLEAALRERELPLVSLESLRPLSAFDVVGFSLQFELTYTNILTMLDLGGLGLRAADRGQDAPLVVAGGPTATHPEPVAEFFDAIVVGDGERKLTEVALCWAAAKREGLGRRERLRALAELGAVYVPALYESRDPAEPAGALSVGPSEQRAPYPVRRAIVDLAEHPFPAAGPVGGPEAVFERSSLEIARGCFEGCRFCQAGMANRPMRERPPEQLLRVAKAAVQHTGNDEVSLTALSPADVTTIHPLICTLSETLAEQGVGLAVSSLRAYGLAPELLDELKRMRAAGLTFAPEAGTQRLRDVINKNVSEAQLRATAERVFARGWSRVKLYFMIGLPTETDEDVLGIIETAARMVRVGREVARRRPQITVSVSTHVPKPHTPFQWSAMDGLAEISRKQDLLRGAARAHRAIKLRVHDAAASRLEALLARGDSSLGRVIERAWRAGARFDAWDEKLRLQCWEQALSEEGIDEEVFLRPAPVGGPLPWSHIDVGLDETFLERELRRALAAKPSAPCGRPFGQSPADAGETAEPSKMVCYHCGADCDLEALRQEREQHLGQLPRDPDAAEPASGRGDRPSAAGPARIGTDREGHRYRLRFEKCGAAALLGHLDIVRELPRVLRRVGTDMVYTAGFHPKPAMKFSPALALGVASLDERVDLRLCVDQDAAACAAWVEQLNQASPQGLRFVSAVRLPDGEPAVTTLITGARYAVVLERSSLEVWLTAEAAAASSPERWLAERCQWLLGKDSLELRRVHRRRERVLDIRPLICEAAPAQGPDLSALSRAGWGGDVLAVRFDVALTPAGSVKPVELSEVLFGSARPAHGLVRVALLGGVPSALQPLPELGGAAGPCAAGDHPI